VTQPSIKLRPVTAEDLPLLARFAVEPGLIGLDWAGFRDAQQPARRFAEDGYLGTDDSRLMVHVEPDDVAGFVIYRAHQYSSQGRHWEIGIALLPDWRGRGIGWRAQAMLCDYLFRHTPAHRVEAGTHPENIAEQKSLAKAGFQLDGVLRGCEFRDGQWHDGMLYSRLRTDPAPPVDWTLDQSG
jgi:ribosomal-protein-alanine N-acetyltransferase